MLNRFIEIGFKQSKPEIWVGAGWCIEYTYYPDYLVDNHFTLVTFSRESGITEKTEYRLYIHNNDNGKYISSIFQLSYDLEWNKNYLDSLFNETFKMELRDLKLNSIIQ